VPLPLLHAIADVPEAVLQRTLTALQSAEFLYETRLFPEHEYTLHMPCASSVTLRRGAIPWRANLP
jgi:hypothetical protein